MNNMPKLELLQYLTYGDVLHHASNKNADGTPQRWRVNGQPTDFEWDEHADLPYVNMDWFADHLIYKLQLPEKAFDKVWKSLPQTRVLVGMRIPVKHGLKNTDQLHLPMDADCIDWKGWSKILRERERKAKRHAREVERSWKRFRKMWMSKNCYWLVMFRPKDGWAIIRNCLLVEDSPDKFAWAEVDNVGRVKQQWTQDYAAMCAYADGAGYERLAE